MSMPNPYIFHSKDIRGVGNLWQRFHAGLVTPEEIDDPYYKILLQDWQRCAALGVDIAMTVARRLSDEEVHERMRSSQLMLDTYLPMVERVKPFLGGCSSTVMLTDASGVVLHMAGSKQALDQAATHSGIVIGSRWEETQAGNNGMGSVLTKREPVHVLATEHFCESLQRWSCSAAPVFDIDGSTIIGIINFTTDSIAFRDDALALPVSLAHSLQERLAILREQDHNLLLAKFHEESNRGPNEKVLVIDHAERVISHTQTAEGHAIAARWRAGERAYESVTRATDVLSPETGQSIGRVLHLSDARPSGYGRVFRQKTKPSIIEATRIEFFGKFLSCDPETIQTLTALEKISRANVNVLLHGETGTGKELIARHIHVLSHRQDAPYLAVNCGAISHELLESTFFGYVRGAFSGADPKGRAGYFEAVGDGTLFLDEIGELPLSMQAALLRVLEDGSFIRVGSTVQQYAKCRIIAATHRNLEQLISEGKFRQDLYYRLKIVQKTIKPLRHRICDVSILINLFKSSLEKKHSIREVRISPAALSVMQSYSWPGNVRELRNVIEAALICSDGEILIEDLPAEICSNLKASTSSSDIESCGEKNSERELVVNLLRKYRKINHVARALGLARSTLYRKFQELDIDQRKYINDD